jgi:intracellular sulfur oxidation DsrE/DsrF family protein
MDVFKVEFQCRNCNKRFWKKFERGVMVNANGVHSFQRKKGEHLNIANFEKQVIKCVVCDETLIDIINRKPL